MIFDYQTLFQGNYMSETFGTITTFLATVIKFWDSTSKSEIINKTANIIYNKKAELSQR